MQYRQKGLLLSRLRENSAPFAVFSIRSPQPDLYSVTSIHLLADPDPDLGTGAPKTRRHEAKRSQDTYYLPTYPRPLIDHITVLSALDSCASPAVATATGPEQTLPQLPALASSGQLHLPQDPETHPRRTNFSCQNLAVALRASPCQIKAAQLRATRSIPSADSLPEVRLRTSHFPAITPTTARLP